MSMLDTTDVTPDSTPPRRLLNLTVNGQRRTVECEDRQLLVTLVREELNLKGTHVGCLNGDCGACTLECDGKIVKSCLMLAASADGSEIVTVDGLGTPEELAPIQEAFWNEDGFQCGFCLPGHLFAARDLIATNPDPTDDEIRQAIAGNLCRCTGYQSIVNSIRVAAAQARAE
ncbi:MAG: 4-hydroxybenzoyl-CoA reductase subunit gamma [Nocardioides sp.]|jgi:carbon-monoxide dehydrogenase small subunit|nr:4-hydroxybenzoyl-CoA reductase subunit gamma [Nocardioides sp.]